MGQLVTSRAAAKTYQNTLNYMFQAGIAHTVTRTKERRRGDLRNLFKQRGGGGGGERQTTLRLAASELMRHVDFTSDDPSGPSFREFLRWVLWIDMDPGRSAEAARIPRAIDWVIDNWDGDAPRPTVTTTMEFEWVRTRDPNVFIVDVVPPPDMTGQAYDRQNPPRMISVRVTALHVDDVGTVRDDD